MGAGLELFSEMGEGVQVPGSHLSHQHFHIHPHPGLPATGFSCVSLPLLLALLTTHHSGIWMALQKHQPVTSLTPAVNGFPSYLRTIFKPLEALTPLALATFLTSPPSTMGSLASTPPPLLLLLGWSEHTPPSGPSHELFPPLDTLYLQVSARLPPSLGSLSPYWRRRDLPDTLRKTPSAIPHSHSSGVSLHLPILHGISP